MGKMKDTQEWNCAIMTDEAIEKAIQQNPSFKSLYQTREEARQKWFVNTIHLENLDPYKATPRDKRSKFVKKAVKANKNLVMDAPLVYCAVVQAQSAFYKPIAPWESFQGTTGGMVVLFTLDERYRYDKAWLTNIANKAVDMKTAPSVPEDMQKLRDNLVNTKSDFCTKVGMSLTGGVEVWCCSIVVDAKELPKKFIPDEKIIPFLVLKDLEDKNFVFSSAGKNLGLIDKEFYS